MVRARKGEHQKIFEDAQRSGFVRVRVDGNLYDLSEEIKLEKNKKHNIEIVEMCIRDRRHSAGQSLLVLCRQKPGEKHRDDPH